MVNGLASVCKSVFTAKADVEAFVDWCHAMLLCVSHAVLAGNPVEHMPAIQLRRCLHTPHRILQPPLPCAALLFSLHPYRACVVVLHAPIHAKGCVWHHSCYAKQPCFLHIWALISCRQHCVLCMEPLLALVTPSPSFWFDK